MQNYIIIVLCILLAITFYLYFTLLNQFENFQKERMCYIKTKVVELDAREKKVGEIEKCQTELNSAKIAIGNVATIVNGLNATNNLPQPEQPPIDATKTPEPTQPVNEK
jgi:hypothetical protein